MPDTTATRITPEIVMEARQALPQYGLTRSYFACFYQNKECLCGMSLVAVHRSLATSSEIFRFGNDYRTLAIRLGLTYGYARSFMFGFDGAKEPLDCNQQGYQDGQECAAALGFSSPDNRSIATA